MPAENTAETPTLRRILNGSRETVQMGTIKMTKSVVRLIAALIHVMVAGLKHIPFWVGSQILPLGEHVDMMEMLIALYERALNAMRVKKMR